MLKMIDVLEQSLVQNFTHSLNSHTSQFDELFNQGILNTADSAHSKCGGQFLQSCRCH